MANESNWRWDDFTPDEMRCKETGELDMDEQFMDRLQALRTEFDQPMTVSSGYRSRKHSAERDKATIGTHVEGKAVDIRVHGREALRLVGMAIMHGFTGIGVSQQGDHRFIHLDTASATAARPRPHIWSY